MDLSRIHKTKIYALLVTFLFAFMPVAGTAMPQRNDVSKPTRERVKSTDKKQTDDKNKNKKDNKTDAANKNDKSAAAAAAASTKKDTKQDTKQNTQASKPVAKKDEQAAVKQDNKTAAKPDDKKEVKPDDKTAAKVDDKASSNTQTADNKPKEPVFDKNYNGIDVSKHQGAINWDVVRKDSKIQYVYIKATEGSDMVDERYQQNLRNARKLGFKVGSYHYLTNKSSVVNQFKNFANTAKREDQDLIPVIDVEVCKQWSAQQLRDSLKVFANMVEDYYGCKPIIYTYENFFMNNLGKAFADYPIFIAKYSRASSGKPNINGVKWIMWQYADNGRVNGITGNVDLSRFNTGNSINDILYKPSKSKLKFSVKEAVDRNKPKPTTATLMEQPKSKEEQAKIDKQKEEADKQAAKQKKVEERKKKQAEADAEKAKAERAKADKVKANKEKAEKAKADKAKAEKEKAEKAKADKAKADKAKADKEKAEAEAKAKRKAAAKQTRSEQTQQKAANKSNKSANISAKMTQSQRNDSIRAAQQKGRKINKSSADND